MKIGLECCPLCGNPLFRKGDPPTEYTKRHGLSISMAFYPGGFHRHAERFRFAAEICESCQTRIAAVLNPLIIDLQERDIRT